MSDKESVLQVATTPVTDDFMSFDSGEQTEIVMAAPSEVRDGGNSMQVNLQTSGLAFQVRTQLPVNNQIIALSARAELLSAQLADSQSLLRQSMQRIGFLEAQLEQKEELIERLYSKNRQLE